MVDKKWSIYKHIVRTNNWFLSFIRAIIIIAAGTIVISPSWLYNANAQQCDQSLWQHVYRAQQRLQVIKPCITVTGIIDEIRTHEADGDFHILLHLDPQFSNLLVPANQREHGDLVLEPVCQHTPTAPNAIAACKNFHQDINIPDVNAHVAVTGAFVRDKEPGHGWTEIHPVTSIVESAPFNETLTEPSP
jgi:hypothetical protein